jgi:lipooligosaccharide transport system ATP-binding protein
MGIITVRNLVKKYRELVAVAGVDLDIEEGECFGFLGPNGAGKTSLIRMITAVSPPSGGEIRVLGKDLRAHSREIKALLGVVPQIDNLDPDLSVLQNLITFARYFDIPKQEARRRAQEALRLLQLEDKRDARIDELSGGMKRRLLIARGLINQPRILILDEPTIGLDPQAKHLVWRKLQELKAQGVTQLLCTQNMEEAAILCDRVAIMHQGRVLTQGTPQELISRYVGQEVWELKVSPEERERVVTELVRHQLVFEDVEGVLQIFGMDDHQPGEKLGDILRGARQRAATLEDVFFRLTGRLLSE